MRLGITTKIFLALLTTSLIATVVMGVSTRVIFQHGFHSYLAEQEQQRLLAISDVLGDIYQERAGWQFLRDHPHQWRRLLRFASRPSRQALGNEKASALPGSAVELAARLSLLDEAGELVAGQSRRGPGKQRYPIVVNGETVGWLAMAPARWPTTGADLHFQEQQFKAGFVTAGLALLLAAVVSVLLVWRLLLPVRQLAAATHTLAGGDYRARVPVNNHDALGRLAKDFNQLASTLERNEELRRAFMADISHELRTPLAVLRGELEALQDGIRELTPESLQSLQGEVGALSRLVDDLYELALADVGAQTYQMTSLDLVELVAIVAQGFEARFAERQLQLNCHLPSHSVLLSGDRLRLTQLLNNLLENSLRYTDPGGGLQLELRRQGQEAVISLQDSAPAVPPELLPRLFERFYRPDVSRSRAHGGAGLGLTLCRSIAEAHGGSIAAQPSPLGGLWVVVRLPLSKKRKSNVGISDKNPDR